MPDTRVVDVRRFNRTVAARIGALDDRFLGGGRPMGAARLLWEIGPEGCELRVLRARMGLDSGYASRLLRSLEAAGLVEVVVAAHDRRARRLRLTEAGAAERRRLDERSDELARSVLAPFGDGQQAELVAAMRTVERLLSAGEVAIAPLD